MKRKRVSLDDIAKSLNVSRSLVSLVLNGKSDVHGISAETKEKVLNKALELNYKPNHFARGLRLGKSFTIGLIVSDIANSFYSKIARNIEDLAEEHGYNLITCSTDEDIQRELRLIKLLRGKQVDGLIISSSQENAEEFIRLKAEGFPFVLIDRYFVGLDIPAVVVNNRSGAEHATNHLFTQGYKRPMALAISPVHVYTIHERVAGFRNELRDMSMKPWIEKVPFEDPFGFIDSLIEKLKKTNQLPDSIFAMNNNIATATLQALRKHNISIPDQIGLVCFDDVPYFNFIQPSITAVAQPIKEISSVSFELLLKLMNGKAEEIDYGPTYLPFEFIVRESTKKIK
ncbi:MAG: LacI family DNA-binding transcriptional regulator [Tenuifilaceae bacterium]